MVYKKAFFALLGILCWTAHSLHAAQLCDKLSHKDKDTPEKVTINHGKNFSGMNFKGKKLPQDLSYADLTGANLAGHHFRGTNFTGAELAGVILTGTTCDYQQCFQDNIIANKIRYGKWYLKNLTKDLESIVQVYPHLLQDSHKALLLQIACGLAYLPYYENTEFYIKLEHWSCQLLILKNQLGDLGARLVCTLASQLKYEEENYCWETDYPTHFEAPIGMKIASRWCILSIHRQLPKELSKLIQAYLTEKAPEIHANFDQYLQLFQEGLVKYNVTSKRKWGDNYYKKVIALNIKGLQKIYPKLTSPKLQKKAMKIAHQLSQKYKIQNWHFLFSYTSCQNQLIWLKASIQGAHAKRSEAFLRVAEKSDIYYNPTSCRVCNSI